MSEYNLRIQGPVSNYDDGQYLSVTYDGNRSWIIDPPKQTLLCKPVSRLKAKSWGMARELRQGLQALCASVWHEASTHKSLLPSKQRQNLEVSSNN